MIDYIRIGEHVDAESDDTSLLGFSNAIEAILFPELWRYESDNAYIFSTPKVQYSLVGIDSETYPFGEYEQGILKRITSNKLYPVFCLHGPMGSGKSTTIKYILNNIMQNVVHDDCKCII